MTPTSPGPDCWHVARGERIDTAVVPVWQRTGYLFFPYAAWESGHSWVLRVNHCFPEHDLMTVFVDGRPVAEASARRDDPRPLVASIGSLPISGDDRRCPVMPVVAARAAVDRVAPFVDHGAEWGEPCDWCTFAERDPYRRAAPDPHANNDSDRAQATPPVIRVEFVEDFRNQDVVLATMNAGGVAALWGAMADAGRAGNAHLDLEGMRGHRIVTEPGAADVESSADRVVWRLDPAKLAEVVQKLGALVGADGPGHHYVDDMRSPTATVVLSRDEYPAARSVGGPS